MGRELSGFSMIECRSEMRSYDALILFSLF